MGYSPLLPIVNIRGPPLKTDCSPLPESPGLNAGTKDVVATWLPEAYGDDPAALLRLAAGPPQRLGELVTDAKPDHEAFVAKALEEARKSGRRVGEALVERGVISQAQLDVLLEFQHHQRRDTPADDRLRLGRILVSSGQITESQLGEALVLQRRTARALGEELVAQGRITQEALGIALRTQRRLVVAALVAALTMVSPGAVSPAMAAKFATQSIDFRIVIPPVIRMQVLRHPETIEITRRDVERGFVEIASGSLLEVTANTAWGVTFVPSSGLARSARVSGFSGDVVVGPEGGALGGLRPMKQKTLFDLSYRVELASGVEPGTYPWPFAVFAHAA